MLSLKGRLSLGLAASLIGLLLLQWLIASVAIKRLTEGQLVARLTHDAESLLAGVQFDAGGNLQLDQRRLSAVYQRPYSGHYFAVTSGADRQFSRSLWDTTLDLPAVASGSETRIRTSGPQQQPLLVLALGFHKQDRDLTIAVAEDLSALNAGLLRFQLIYGLGSAAVLIALLLLQRLIVAQGLRPLEAVKESMQRLERGEVPRIEAAGPSEIMPLIAQLNRLLNTMGSRTRRSREALGNLAHALKTRLAILNQAGERPELAAHPQLRSAIRESTEAIRRIAERELKRARLMGDALPGQRVNLEDEVSLLTQTLKVLHADKSPAIDWQVAEGTRFLGDREDLLELLGNLLDNACKWCRGRVSLTIANGNGCHFTVEDDGPGCAPEEIDVLTQRGFRADESIPGSGLGLAIVKDVVESYGGTLTFGRSASLGGLRVEIRLPAAPRDITPGS
jgi:signal transduction histidine kinase